MNYNSSNENSNNDIKKYWEKRLNDNYGLHGTGYIGLGKNYNIWMYKVRKHIVNKKLQKFQSNFSSANVLDIGSGSGFYVDIWKHLGVKNITGCDITSVSVKNLSNKYPEGEFLEFDISSNVIPISKQFDYVTAFDVLFHIVDDEKYAKAISNIYNLLKPNGILFFSENFIHKKTARSRFQSTRSLDEIQSLLQRSGFQILERSPMFYLMNTPVDSDGVIINKFWHLVKKVASKGETFGRLVGGILYPFELMMISTKSESPSTEIMICKKQ
ncbi:class I SAM-dependent methyltransferase [Candidatus Nitrosocosmicus franklandus]|uniref:Class I SAM-dependent methyltransferase n=1 Tax=Candidatus Nitrosocosmicus franklandianus TaxID=1798806 RepID=A0A484IJE1_9ARCH|nr:class I SAM-dependent methyltransferase [Candidatus Nitrosocosmicus franklandus]VFJ15008.1 Class I SAM-dependent methyltransferase [Candidatus Nitrosocosmicus franklandus]